MFDYEVPAALVSQVQPGSLVRVSFGSRTIEGFVLELASSTDYTKRGLKPIEGLAPGKPLISSTLLKLARWLSDYYLAPIERCLKVMFPPVVRGGVEEDGFKRRQYVRKQPDPQKILIPKPTLRQTEILHYLGDNEEMVTGFCKAWGVSLPTLRKMEACGLVIMEDKIERRDPLLGRAVAASKPLPLTPEQSAALTLVRSQLTLSEQGGTPKPILLRGVTASGKTEVYLQAIAEVLARGKSAIVLVPEIALTPQTIRRFAGRFGSIVAVLHSQLSAGERHDEWQRLRRGEARVAIGPRSALFAPLEKLGLIIVDEEHEPSYKQDDTPRYHARDVAVVRARFEGCAVLLGSATPSLESWRNAQIGKYLLVTMTKRAVEGGGMPHTVIVDMRSEIAKSGGKRPLFSQTLAEAIERRLDCGEQVMLFLNRRGWAPVVSCPSCGWTDTCENCSVGMTYHQRDDVVRCHVCGAFRPAPQQCPKCGNPDVKFTGMGTQRVEDIAHKFFPRANIARMDVDVTTRKNSHEEILRKFRAGKTDILIGTQMIAKGLDFPNVTLAGILNADTGLNIPDFRASERTFQLIAQMAGRVGRGVKPGDVVVQTTCPDEPAIVRAQTEDFEGFAAQELVEREQLRYPPYTHYVEISFKSASRVAAESYATRFAQGIGESPTGEYLLGAPVPAPLEKVRGDWVFEMTLRGENPGLLLQRLHAVKAAYPEPDCVNVAIDVDAH